MSANSNNDNLSGSTQSHHISWGQTNYESQGTTHQGENSRLTINNATTFNRKSFGQITSSLGSNHSSGFNPRPFNRFTNSTLQRHNTHGNGKAI